MIVNEFDKTGLHFLLLRHTGTKGYTKGILLANGEFECYTLEDEIRAVKIYGETAIPEGTFQIVTKVSPHFNKTLPHLLDVPGFTDILIHSGNTVKDTKGCILVGGTQEDVWLGSSVNALRGVMIKIYEALKSPYKIFITIKNVK